MAYVLNGKRVRKLTYKKEMAALRDFFARFTKCFTKSVYGGIQPRVKSDAEIKITKAIKELNRGHPEGSDDSPDDVPEREENYN